MNPALYLKLVEEFHVAMNYRTPTPKAPAFDNKTTELRVRLIEEEFRELIESANDIDRLDACADIQYVLSGAVLALGIQSLFEYKPLPVMRRPSEIDKCIKRFKIHCQLHLAFSSARWLSIMQRELHLAIRTYGYATKFDAAFETVHASNMSKLWSEDEVDACFEPYTFEISGYGEGKWIARRNDGKIIKPPSFTKPDLQPFV